MIFHDYYAEVPPPEEVEHYLAALRLTVGRTRVKFKLAQNRPAQTRRQIIEFLRARGRRNEARGADALEWTLTQATREPAPKV